MTYVIYCARCYELPAMALPPRRAPRHRRYVVRDAGPSHPSMRRFSPYLRELVVPLLGLIALLVFAFQVR